METKKIQASQYARSLIEASLDPLVTISAEGKITDVNEASVKATGIAREKLINTDFSDYFTDPKKAKEGYLQVFEKGFVADYPLTIKHKNGKLTDVLYNASVYKDDKGNVLGVFAAARDVTVQKQASQYARSLIEASLDPLVTISPKGKITDVNEASVKATGIAREKLINTDFSDYFTDPKKAKEGYLQVFEKGFVADYPLTIKHKNGKLTDVLYNASVYKDDKGNVLGVFAAARDVNNQKWAIELRKVNKELVLQNKEKEKRADELVIANKELAFQNEEKEKRAHELAIANKELAFQNKEKEKRADELVKANKELAFQNTEKEKRANELAIANKELAFQNKEKEKRADELIITNTKLAYQIEEKKKAAAELVVLNKKLALKNKEKEKRESELIIANKELAYQIEEKEKKGAELVIVNRKLAFQIQEKEKTASELIITNKELAFQIEEKEKRAAELNIANRKLALQNEEKEKKTIELIIANKELAFQNKENVKLTVELTLINKMLADYKYAIDQSSIVTIIDTHDNIKHVNDNFFKISQHSQDELLGHKYPIINPEFHPKEYIQNIQKTIAEGKIWKGELRNKSKDESIYWVNTTIVPFLIKNGKPYQYAIIQFDITDRKKAEQTLKEHLKVLEYQNTQLNDFCYIISHNLRGPLINIAMLVDYIENSDSEKEQKEMLKKIRPVVNKINETFDELVESLQVKYDLKIKLEKINLRLSFEKALALLEYEITSNNAEIEINISDTPVINFPKKYMNSILFNLISNSLKFRSPDRKPIIKIKTKRIKDSIVLSITDNSLGIDLKMHKKDVFKIRKVFHEHPDARGFGLFMIKTQIEAMGGKIWVESNPDKGSTFFVEFINQHA